MWYLPNLSITFFLKNTLGLSAARTATFFTALCWLLVPLLNLEELGAKRRNDQS
jgi:hypothetical protein